MSAPSSPAASSSSSSDGEPSGRSRKSWPPSSSKNFLIDDYHIPKDVIDVDLMEIEFLTVDDPAFFIHYASDAEIHAALALQGTPVPQGATAAASATAFRQFVQAFFVQHSPGCRIPRLDPAIGFSDCAFQRLSNHEAEDILNESINFAVWMATVSVTVGARTGTTYVLTPSAGGAAAGGRSPQGKQTRRPLFVVP